MKIKLLKQSIDQKVVKKPIIRMALNITWGTWYLERYVGVLSEDITVCLKRMDTQELKILYDTLQHDMLATMTELAERDGSKTSLTGTTKGDK